MKTISSKAYVILSVILCAAVMSYVDAVVQPGYAQKSAVKAALFLLVPIAYFVLHQRSWGQVRELLVPTKKDILAALGLGCGVYAVILGGYLILARFIDISGVVLKLTADAGVNAGNFGGVSLYISLVNSLLEEFLFRGFAFITLKKLTSRKFAYLFSAVVFALYHFGMVAGGSILVWAGTLAALVAAGYMFNWLNEKSGNIITSWLVHMFANFAINTIGFMIFGLI